MNLEQLSLADEVPSKLQPSANHTLSAFTIPTSGGVTASTLPITNASNTAPVEVSLGLTSLQQGLTENITGESTTVPMPKAPAGDQSLQVTEEVTSPVGTSEQNQPQEPVLDHEKIEDLAISTTIPPPHSTTEKKVEVAPLQHSDPSPTQQTQALKETPQPPLEAPPITQKALQLEHPQIPDTSRPLSQQSDLLCSNSTASKPLSQEVTHPKLLLSKSSLAGPDHPQTPNHIEAEPKQAPPQPSLAQPEPTEQAASEGLPKRRPNIRAWPRSKRTQLQRVNFLIKFF